MDTKQFLKLSCSELERRTKVNKGCWSRYFNKEFNPSWENLLKISKALNMTTEELVYAIEQKRNQVKA